MASKKVQIILDVDAETGSAAIRKFGAEGEQSMGKTSKSANRASASMGMLNNAVRNW